MKTFKFSETQTVKTNFEAYFGTSFGQFYDGLMSVLTKSLKIDIFKFDDYLHKKHGQYENENLSMNTAIIKYYGKKASEFIDSLI
jgi:hypothetical protein